MIGRHTNTVIGASHIVLSGDGTKIGYLSLGAGPSVLVIPGVLSMAADYAAFARALAETAPREVAKAVSGYFLRRQP